MAEAPLLSQDEFFRHLDLRSVHRASARYHYRQALKERLRASSKITLKSEPPEEEKKSPQVSPCKWLSPAQCRKLFGRPKIRIEKRESVLNPLIQNCHVLRHPGIKKEFQGFQNDTENRSQIRIKKEYLRSNETVVRDLVVTDEIRAVCGLKDAHCRSFRPQPGRRKTLQILEHEKQEKPKMVAKLNRLVTPSVVDDKPVKKSKFPRIRLSGNTSKLLGSPASILRPSKVVNVDTKRPRTLIKPQRPSRLALKVVLDVKTKFGTSMTTCRICGRRFKVMTPLKDWKEALEADKNHFCGVCKTLIHSEDHQEDGDQNKCDICSKRFGKRSNMIRHITSNHPLNMHKVELAKFSCKRPLSELTQTGNPLRTQLGNPLGNPGWLDCVPRPSTVIH